MTGLVAVLDRNTQKELLATVTTSNGIFSLSAAWFQLVKPPSYPLDICYDKIHFEKKMIYFRERYIRV